MKKKESLTTIRGMKSDATNKLINMCDTASQIPLEMFDKIFAGTVDKKIILKSTKGDSRIEEFKEC